MSEHTQIYIVLLGRAGMVGGLAGSLTKQDGECAPLAINTLFSNIKCRWTIVIEYPGTDARKLRVAHGCTLRCAWLSNSLSLSPPKESQPHPAIPQLQLHLFGTGVKRRRARQVASEHCSLFSPLGPSFSSANKPESPRLNCITYRRLGPEPCSDLTLISHLNKFVAQQQSEWSFLFHDGRTD
jgi:hypothetical protein